MPESPLKPTLKLDDLLDGKGLPPVIHEWPDALPAYAELHCLSNFSFQRGASHPQELVMRAYNQGYHALAITDECSVAGVVRAWTGLKHHLDFIKDLEADPPGEKRSHPFRLLYGSEFDFGDGKLVAIARDKAGWGGLCEFITAARTTIDTPKGEYFVDWATSNLALLHGCEVLFAPQRSDVLDLDTSALTSRLSALKQLFGPSLWLAVELHHAIDDDLWLWTLGKIAEMTGVAMVAAGDVHMHLRSRKPLQDVITAVRLGKTVETCGFELQANAERHLRPRLRLGETYPPELLAATLVIANRCTFDLREIQYDYPLETVPEGLTPTEGLRKLTYEGAAERYPDGVPQKVAQHLEKELQLIAECQYEMFFLTVHDIVRFARSKKILCQGRGSAANSVVCFCLGVTAMDPMHSNPLLERFISKERRNEPPDIDVDFEHERREEVIQYIYGKYGRERAAIAAVVISYRTRSAIRDVGKALGVDDKLVEAFAKEHFWFDEAIASQKLMELAQKVEVQIEEFRAALWLDLTQQLMGFPRHLSQHVGGFVLTQTKLTQLVPVEKATMKDRSIIQWDKDDLEEMGLMKVDVLALGMLTALRRALDLRNQLRGGKPWGLADIPKEDKATYDMICKADTVGTFQIESRAQMSMLPRLKPREFYDLVVEVAIVRPGPIQGGMVHPFLKARERLLRGEKIHYESEALKPALERTLGIPIFQEQVMQIAMIAAGFSAEKADALRRSMAAWKRKGGVDKFYEPIIKGMTANGYRREFAEAIFKQILGFGEYGFPESHAYSFALIAYASAWLKCHEPECFLAAMLNSQPMGFYTPSQLVQDGKRHGIVVLPPDVSHSDWDSKLGSDSNFADRPYVRLGLRLVGGLTEAGGQRVVEARNQSPFSSTEDMAMRAQLDAGDLKALAAGDALMSLSGHRRQQVWDATALRRTPELLRNAPVNEDRLELPAAAEGEEIVFDYESLGLTLRRHPLALLRPRLSGMKLQSAAELHDLPSGRQVRACGIVTVRQQPQTAHGTIFLTLEDETGPVNVIVWKSLREEQRDDLLQSRLLAVEGIWQRDVESGGEVRNLIARRLKNMTPLLGRLARGSSQSRDFH
ncbi:error-prone DNA polymerase [Caenimonas koreensis]|uniref:error-prone DNA polymerase n=1 Tax=Caenimonas koreensis TaxID=367474 RepID=UPI0037852327